jgi:probable HAF family extracellular repeat protein
MQDIGSLNPAEPETHAYAAAEAGLVVGQSLAFTAGPTAFYHPFLWDGTQLRDLGAIGATGDPEYCAANPCSHGLSADVNAAGQVVGWSTDSAGTVRGFLWRNGAMQDLGGFSGLATWAVSVNARGQIVGEYSADFHTDLRAFIWDGGATRDLGSLGGGRTGVLAINDEGLVSGYSRRSNGEQHAFMWREGRMYDLGPGLPTAMNERGDIVGVSSRPPGPERAMLWRRRPQADMVAMTP